METMAHQRQENGDLAEKALMWIRCVARPLSAHELQSALAVNEDEGELDGEIVVPVEDVISACAGFVVLDDESSSVHLANYTTQEHLGRSSDQWLTESNLKIAKTCVAVLSSDRPGPLIEYASKFWCYHLRQEPNAQRDAWVLDFLESEHVAWALSKLDIFYTTDQATGLHLAAYFGLDVAVDAFIRRSHNPNVPGGCGRTPIFYAAKGGHCSTIRVLVKLGARIDIGCLDNWDRWPLLEAAHGRLYDVVELLLEIEANNDPEIETLEYRDAKNLALARSVLGGDARMVTLLLNKGASIEYQDGLGTPLMISVVHENEGIVMTRLLIERGANVDSRDRLGETALMKSLSSARENPEQIRFLLESKADIEVCDSIGRTALTRAADLGKEEMVRLLIQRGAEIEGSPSGPTPLYLAVHGRHTAVVKLLLEGGADPALKNDWQQISSLELAKSFESSDTLVLLQAHRRDRRLGWQDWLSSYFH